MDHTDDRAPRQAAPGQAATPPLPGQDSLLAGRYRLAETLGRGGMGKVWRAHDEVLHRTVAVKELTAAIYVSEAERAVLLARTQKEARAAARINHTAVVTVHDVFEYDDRPWIVMELVDGGSLADAVSQDERIAPREAARIGIWVLRALRAAHEAGVLHRDVKPANILISSDGRVKLTDFGIAAIEGDSTITRTGELVGSLDFLAPERVRGADPGPAADLWALGVSLFAAVEGFSPFRRTSPLSTMQAVVTDEPGEPEHAGPLAPVITALLHKDPELRPTAAEAEQMLAEVAEGHSPQAAQAYVPTRRVPAEQLAPFRDTAQGQLGQQGQPGQPGQPQPGEFGQPGEYGPYAYPGQHLGPQHSGPQHSGPQHSGPQYPAPQHPAPQRTGRGRRGRRIALGLAAGAVVLGIGAAIGIVAYNERGGGTAGPGPGPSVSEEHQTGGALPDDWVRVKDDVEGFSLLVPPGWKRQTESGQVDFTPDNGRHLIRIGVNDTPDFENSYLHALDMEKQGMGRIPTYERIKLKSASFRDRPGAIWEFTWTETSGANRGERRAIDQLYFAEDGTEYAIYMSGPAQDWDKTRQQFETVLRSWQPPN